MSDMQDVIIFSNKIKEAKQKLGYNHNEFATFIDHPRDTYMHWYKADYMPNATVQADVLAKIKAKLG